MKLLYLLLIASIVSSCKRQQVPREPNIKSQTHEVQIRFINEFDLEIKRTNNTDKVQYFINDMAGGNIWILTNKNYSDTIDLGYRGDMDAHKLQPSEVNIDTFDFYRWMLGNGPEDGKYDLKYFDERNNVKSNITLFDFSRIKYNRPNSTFRDFLEVTLDSIDYDTYNINIHNLTIYDIEVENLDIFLSSESINLDKKYHFYTEYYMKPKTKLSKNTKRKKLKPNKTLTITYKINEEDVREIQSKINGIIPYNIAFGLKSTKYPLFYDLKHFNRDELAIIKNDEK